MGMGYALSEQYQLRNGVPTTTDLKKCGLMTIDQTPEMITLIIEDDDPGGPYGAKGISEVATVPITPCLSRRKSILRYMRLCPPPMRRMEMWP
mgnify:CR=1 FL=1